MKGTERARKLKRIVGWTMALLLLFALPAGAEPTETTPYNWYFQKNDSHRQPELDANLSFLEDYDCVYLNKGTSEKVLYLTFDAGYENGNVEKILDALKKHNAQGAFFVLEHLVKCNTPLVRRMAEEGHLVCNHTAKHPDMSRITDKTLFCKQLSALERICAMRRKRATPPFSGAMPTPTGTITVSRTRKGRLPKFWPIPIRAW